MMNTGKKLNTNKMKKIDNVVLCGLGGVGCVCAAAIADNKTSMLKVLLDKERYERYKKQPTFFNSKEYNFEYILPNETNFKADLIIIATKNDGLDSAIKNIKNFIHENTIIISLLNGIHSEDKIMQEYANENILTSFYIGHSCIRNNRSVSQDGLYEIVIGSTNSSQVESLENICTFFEENNIKYRKSNSIKEEYWKKFMINVGVNQLCAATGLTLKELRKDNEQKEKLKFLIKEVSLIAKAEKIKNYNNICNDAITFLLEEMEDATPSMLQDIKAGKKTELDIFAGEVIKLGKKYNIQTPYNEEIYKKIKQLEEIKN